MHVKVERIYDYQKRSKKRGEYAVLVDRLWPRGIAKDDVELDEWLKELAPSDELRKWFGHEESRWSEFQRRYRAELDEHPGEVKRLREIGAERELVLLFGAKDEEHNQAVVLQERLQKGS